MNPKYQKFSVPRRLTAAQRIAQLEEQNARLRNRVAELELYAGWKAENRRLDAEAERLKDGWP